MGKLILPPNYEDSYNSLIFLAGPIQGAPNWQKSAIELIKNFSSCVDIASPRRIEQTKGDFSPEMYNEQVDWETYHLREAGKNGVVLFWLSNPDLEKQVKGRAYAQTSRFELAEWKMLHEIYGSKLVVGIDSKFSNGKYIKRRFSQDCPDIEICDSLYDACLLATKLAV